MRRIQRSMGLQGYAFLEGPALETCSRIMDKKRDDRELGDKS